MTTSQARGPIGRALDRLYLLAGYLAACFLIVIFLLMMALSAGRELRLNIPSGDDFAAWSMAAMAFLGLAHTFKHGEMIRVGLLIDHLQGRKRWLFEVFSLSLGVFFTGYFTWYAFRLTYDSWRLNDMSQGVVPVPLWIPQIGFVFGIGLLAVAFLDELIRVLSGKKPTYEREAPKSAAEVIERAMESAV